MKKFKPWRKRLLKRELKHLKEVGVTYRKQFALINNHHNLRRKEVGSIEPCYECKVIAGKLGLEVYEKNKIVRADT